MTKNNSNDKKGYIAAIAMSLIIGMQFIFIKESSDDFSGNVFGLLLVRFIIGFIVLLPFTNKVGKKDLFRKDILILCLIQPCINLILQTYGVINSSVSAVAYISATGPAITLICSCLIAKEKPAAKQYFAIFSVIAGAVMISLGKDKGENQMGIGAVLIALSLLTRSLYAVKVKKIPQDITPLTLCYAQLMWGFVFYAVSAAVFSKGGIIITLKGLDTFGWLSLMYTGVLSLTGVYLLNNYSLSKISVTASGILSNITFIVTLVSGIIFYKEKLTVLSAIGCGVIACGVLLIAGKSGKQNKG